MNSTKLLHLTLGGVFPILFSGFVPTTTYLPTYLPTYLQVIGEVCDICQLKYYPPPQLSWKEKARLKEKEKNLWAFCNTFYPWNKNQRASTRRRRWRRRRRRDMCRLQTQQYVKTHFESCGKCNNLVAFVKITQETTTTTTNPFPFCQIARQ